jgi:DNA processing protein
MTLQNRYDTATQVLALTHFAHVGPRLFDLLMHHFARLEDIFCADRDTLAAIDGMTRQTAEKLARHEDLLAQAEQFHTALGSRDILVSTRFDDAFPVLLSELNDPPPLLYVRGRLPENNRETAALIGAENATNRGIELTVRLAGEFARAGVQVVSSLSKGIDAAAHVGARGANGVSFGVLDSGLDHIHPAEHMPLALDIAHSGGVLSEYPPDRPHDSRNIPCSNRILVGLAHAVVATEVYRDSSRTLDLLRFCREIGKLAFLLVNPAWGALADETSLAEVVECGAIPLVGLEKVNDITRALV